MKGATPARRLATARDELSTTAEAALAAAAILRAAAANVEGVGDTRAILATNHVAGVRRVQ